MIFGLLSLSVKCRFTHDNSRRVVSFRYQLQACFQRILRFGLSERVNNFNTIIFKRVREEFLILWMINAIQTNSSPTSAYTHHYISVVNLFTSVSPTDCIDSKPTPSKSIASQNCSKATLSVRGLSAAYAFLLTLSKTMLPVPSRKTLCSSNSVKSTTSSI